MSKGGKCQTKALELLKLCQNSDFKQQEFEMGIDEAGRGPVFGAMVYGAAWWPIKYSQKCAGIGFNDSKQLTEGKREELFEAMKLLRDKVLFYKEEILSAIEISNKMFGEGVHNENLNQQSHNAAMRLIQFALDSGLKIKKVFLDTVGDPQKYQKKLEEKFSFANLEIVVSKKADSIFKVVSAASIVAKVTRDKILDNWKFIEPIKPVGQLGSGYPADPKTKEWLQLNKDPVFGYPNLIRFSWGTAVTAMQPLALVFPSQRQQKQKPVKKPRLQQRFNIIDTIPAFIS